MMNNVNNTKTVSTKNNSIQSFMTVEDPMQYQNSQFEFTNYDQKPAFASFLPGIGGTEGIPLWCLYVNRGQAISSFGVGNKDNAIVEFLPANWAYQLASIQGFRTFCKLDGVYYEPFQNNRSTNTDQIQRTMSVQMDRLVLHENNQTLGLQFEVTYFSPVNKPIGSLARVLRITNTTTKTVQLEGIDGLPLIIPAGMTDVGIKTVRHILEAYSWVRMINNHVPFYATKVVAHDEAEVEEVQHGNFYAAWISTHKDLIPIQPYIDPDLIFGENQSLVTPHNFIEMPALDRQQQVSENKLACAMAPFDVSLDPGKSVVLTALSGMAPNESMLVSFLSDFNSLSDFEQASVTSQQTMQAITQPAFIVSAKPQLDAYARQNYLDNVLRGGVPTLMPSQNGPTLLHIYSRRHGDAERDYNFFDLPPSPLSSGEGNYRDICQNRRSDIYFYPEVYDREIRMFLSLIQADGYNPLSIKGYRWSLNGEVDPMPWCPTTETEAQAAFKKLMGQSFVPGELLSWTNTHSIDIPDRMRWLNTILGHCKATLSASGHEGGYWIDHWTYILDLLKAFHAIYPDRTQTILTETADIEWFFEPAHVVPRDQKYLQRKSGPLQLRAVVDSDAPSVTLPPVTVLAKLCALLAIKTVSLDYEGRGIEMEAGRPGWNDSLNGLPGLFGSSTCEAIEVLNLAQWLLEILPTVPAVSLPAVVAQLVNDVTNDLAQSYDWDRSSTIRESFRQVLYTNDSKDMTEIPGKTVESLLSGIISRFEDGLKRSLNPQTGLLDTYYSHEPLRAEEYPSDEGHQDSMTLNITQFKSEPLPLFLEGQVHWLRVCSSEQAKDIYKAVQQSPLWDEPLQMYKLNVCLEVCPPEIGRARTFSRGWFENESIWLHMSTKYLLELVNNELYEAFFTDAKTMLVPFMNPKVYGRSILENSSFIASSACPDPAARGRGFIARLSGTTAEFIHIMHLLTIGKQPFTVRDNQLVFALNPALPAQWFTQKTVTAHWNQKVIQIPSHALACTLLGKTLVVYHNPHQRNTFGSKAVHPTRYVLDNKEEIDASEITGAIAERIRQQSIQRMDVWLQ